jgi:hypothetical protein
MTPTQVVQHPNTGAAVHICLGVIAGLFLQHGIDAKESIQNLSTLISSEEGKAVVLAAVAAFSAFRNGLGAPQQFESKLETIAAPLMQYDPAVANRIAALEKCVAAFAPILPQQPSLPTAPKTP